MVLCRELKEGLRAMFCSMVSKPSQGKIWENLFKKLISRFFSREGTGGGGWGEVFPLIGSAVYVRRPGVGFLCTDGTLSILFLFVGVNSGLLKWKTLEGGAYLRKHFTAGPVW